jgi:hypothetical protein
VRRTRAGLQLAEVVVAVVLLFMVLVPLVVETVTSRRALVKSERSALARALVAYLAEEGLAGVAGSLTPLRPTPAAQLPELVDWAASVADQETLRRAWGGIEIERQVLPILDRRRVTLRAVWPEGKARGQVEVVIEVGS